MIAIIGGVGGGAAGDLTGHNDPLSSHGLLVLGTGRHPRRVGEIGVHLGMPGLIRMGRQTYNASSVAE